MDKNGSIGFERAKGWMLARLVSAFVVLAVVALAVVASAFPPGGGKEGKGDDMSIREAVVADQFYPGKEAALRAAVDAFLADAVPAKGVNDARAIIAPHAGFVFSGQIAADAWVQAKGRKVDLVVILGTNHTVADLPGAAVSPAGGFRNPLGIAEVDAGARDALIATGPDFLLRADAHAREHSVEVQIPFAQVIFPKAKILPLVIGDADPARCERIGVAIAKAFTGRNVLVVASTDLSHYPSADVAAVVDRDLIAAAASLDPARLTKAVANGLQKRSPGLSTCACGEGPIRVAMAYAKAVGAMKAVAPSYANSGDSLFGDDKKVVGYGAVAFFDGKASVDLSGIATEQPADGTGELSAADRKALLSLARRSVTQYLASGSVPLPRHFSPKARRNAGAFVTLKRGHDLRGCIGNMAGTGPLARTVGTMALKAAFEDPRFPQVRADELPHLTFEISALTPMTKVAGFEAIVVGRDGVLLAKGGRSAVFLPQVAPEQGWGRDEMLDHLAAKAGLPKDAWRNGATFETFRAEVFSEGDDK